MIQSIVEVLFITRKTKVHHYTHISVPEVALFCINISTSRTAVRTAADYTQDKEIVS